MDARAQTDAPTDEVLSSLDWGAPWLVPYGAFGALGVPPQASVAQTLNALNALNAVGAVGEAASAAPAPVQFVPATDLPEGEAYEAFISRTGCCPTRDNLHDFFNGLVWLRFPETKRQLNRLQSEQIGLAGVQATRGPVRDALTVFDENAALLLAPDALWQALLARDWSTLFVTLRPLWQGARLVLFGHALLEKLVHPRKAITAHVYRAPEAWGLDAGLDLRTLDSRVAQGLSAPWLATKPFAPLPVLGVPGWSPDNENFLFYDDSVVFRRPQGAAA